MTSAQYGEVRLHKPVEQNNKTLSNLVTDHILDFMPVLFQDLPSFRRLCFRRQSIVLNEKVGWRSSVGAFHVRHLADSYLLKGSLIVLIKAIPRQQVWI